MMPGTKVTHARWGSGVVQESEPFDGETAVRVRLDVVEPGLWAVVIVAEGSLT